MGSSHLLPCTSITRRFGGNKEVFINSAPNLGDLRAFLRLDNLFCKAQEFPFSQRDWNPNPCPEVSHYCLSVLLKFKTATQTGLRAQAFSLWCTLAGFSVTMASHSSLSLSPRSGVRSLPDHSRWSCRRGSVRPWDPGARGCLHPWCGGTFPAHAFLWCFQPLCAALRARECKEFMTVHSVVVSQELVPSEAHIPAWDSACA